VQLLKKCARDSDVVARYSKEEFVVLMPQTSLPGSIAFSERLLRCTDHLAHSVLAIGLVEVQADDDAPKLLSRADSALYSARAQGFHSIYKHNGKTIKEHKLLEYADPTARATEPTPDPATEPATEPTPEAPNATR
jgi:GGDEF domain-containing protein